MFSALSSSEGLPAWSNAFWISTPRLGVNREVAALAAAHPVTRAATSGISSGESRRLIARGHYAPERASSRIVSP
jgi:hypothetical protein